MKTKIGFLCSFSMQMEMVRDIADGLSDGVDMQIGIGVLEQAIPTARRMERSGAEVIVCLGITTFMIEKEISVPVVAVRSSDFDVMRAVKQAAQFGKRIALLTPGPLSGIDLLEELYGIEIKQLFFKNVNDVNHAVVEAFNDGYEVVIGRSHIPLEMAREYGKRAIIIALSREAVVDALQEAVRIARIRMREREEYARLETIFNSLTEGVIAVDDRGKITLFNQAAERILLVNAREALGRPVEVVLPHSPVTEPLKRGTIVENHFLELRDRNIIASYIPIVLQHGILGVVVTFREASEIQKIDGKIRKRMLSRGFVVKYRIDHFLARSAAMKRIIGRARRFAVTDSTVLITGESGTGKEVLAQSIHQLSLRSQKPFVAINCSVLAENLLESELFGYEEGAFTGAKKGGKTGLFELAHGGTLFLDEIGTMPINLQSKLLRVLEERQVMRLGGEQLIPVDVRIIASTNRDLSAEVRGGAFRDDLYFRLNVLDIRMPALRERKEDIPDLIAIFISRFCERYGEKVIRMPNTTIRVLQNYPWPGNVRQLEHFLERFVLLHNGFEKADSLLGELLDERVWTCEPSEGKGESGAGNAFLDGGTSEHHGTLRSREREMILRALETTNFNKSQAALFLGMSRSTLYRKLRIYGLN